MCRLTDPDPPRTSPALAVPRRAPTRLVRLLAAQCLGVLLAGAALVALHAVPAGAGDLSSGDPAWRWPLRTEPAPGRSPVGPAERPAGGAAGRVVRDFDPPDLPYGPGHRGLDIAGEPGEPVFASGPGVVSFAGTVAGRGVVAVTHPDGRRTTYEPLRPTVRVGQRVTGDDVLGILRPGHPGCPGRACLHWGLLRGTDYLDPLALLGGRPARLLPADTDRAATSAGGAEQAPGPAEVAGQTDRTARQPPPVGRVALVTAVLLGSVMLARGRRP